jgi:hypothetical protein
MNVFIENLSERGASVEVEAVAVWGRCKPAESGYCALDEPCFRSPLSGFRLAALYQEHHFLCRSFERLGQWRDHDRIHG